MKQFIFVFLLLFNICARGDFFQEWIDDFKSYALEQGISPKTLNASLNNIAFSPQVVDAYHNQKENHQSAFSFVFDYIKKLFVLTERIEEGRLKMREHHDLLEEVSQKYHVPIQYIVALWAVESRYGAETEKYPVIQTLATLAFASNRKEMFKKELILALKMIDQGYVNANSFYGSWAGAMGQCQFMPSSFFEFAVEINGKKDIWDSLPHVFGSIANYLKKSGWNEDEPWGHQILLPFGFKGEIGLKKKYTNDQLQNMGVRKIGGGDLEFLKTQTSIIMPLGPSGPTYLIYPNFRIILRWNKSQKFALSVCILADGLIR